MRGFHDLPRFYTFSRPSQTYNTALFRAPYTGACLLLVRWFSPWVLTVSFCHTDEPMGTEFQSSTYFLFPIHTDFPAGGLFCFPPACLLFFSEHISSALKMEDICPSESSVGTRRTTRRHIPEDDTLHLVCVSKDDIPTTATDSL
jgi:hypothetical protein